MRMLIRRDAFAEVHELRIAVALRYVTENLIVRAVFFENEEDVLDRAARAHDGSRRYRRGVTLRARRIRRGFARRSIARNEPY